MNIEDLPFSLIGLGHALQAKHLSPVEVVEVLLERIETLDKNLNAFITVLSERALAAARQAEKEIMVGKYRGRLHGIPVALKDIIYTEYARTTMGSAFFKEYIPDYSATVVSKLEDAGAIVIGKTNTHEFAYGATGDRSFFGPVRNPHDLAKISGGSSSGSAVAVAASLCYGALGSDTAGSVRIPSALCGVVGMKPTFGWISKRGVFPLSWRFNAIAGPDSQDPCSVGKQAENFVREIRQGVKGGTIGVPVNFFEHVQDEIAEKVKKSIDNFRSLGARVKEVEIPHVEETLKAQRLILASEAYAIHKERLDSAPEKFDKQVRKHLIDSGQLEAWRYVIAKQHKNRSLREYEKVFRKVDVLLSPTVPIVATEIGHKKVNSDGCMEPVDAALTRLTGPTNLVGLPSLSINCGFDSSGLPVGLQLIGCGFDEATIFRYAYAYESTRSGQPKVHLTPRSLPS